MKKLLTIAAAALLVGAAAVGVRIGTSVVNLGDAVTETISTVAEATLPPEPVTVTEQAMVQAINLRLELTVAELTFTTSVETGTCGETEWQRWAWDDCLTMTVPGKTEVDILLDEFGIDNIESDEQTVTIRLPGVIVGDVNIDNANITITDYNQGTFVFDPDPNLQAQGLAEAEIDLHGQACRSDLLQEEALHAADRVKNLLQPLFEAVDDSRTILVVLGETVC